jgi:hypothetical protein
MKISGFTFIKNAIINDYPIIEAITSILPVVDEMIVSVGDCEDGTRELIQSIASEKIKIYDSVWDPALREGGKVLAVETDKALAHISSQSDWAFYIQADEVVHEKYHAAIIAAAEKYANAKNVEGLLFKYKHFYGVYDYVGDSRKWYRNEIRIIRNDKNIHAYRDAQGFRKENRKLRVKLIDAYIFHYGWVKNTAKMKDKIKNLNKLWLDDASSELRAELFDYNDFDSIKKFTGTHPSVMQKRIREQNWNMNLDVSQKKMSLKKRALYWVEKKTGIRLFEYKNYKII